MILALCFILLQAIHKNGIANAHAVMRDPSPRLDEDTSLKAHPCGSDGQYNAFDMSSTAVLQPGRQAITFRETIPHTGAPYRLALSFENDDHYDSYVLLDQIPHNQNGTASRVGDGKLHRVWVDIPDVDCTGRKCGLQLIQVMTDKFDGVCAPSELVNSCGNVNHVYFSCSNVNIQGTSSSVWPPLPFYNAYDGSTKPRGWEGVTGDWEQATDGYWELAGNVGPSTTTTTGVEPRASNGFIWPALGGVMVLLSVVCYFAQKRYLHVNTVSGFFTCCTAGSK